MNSTPTLTTLCALLLCAVPAAAEEDPFHGKLFPPELLMAHRDELGLTEAQLERVRAHVDAASAEADVEHERQAGAMQKLNALLQADEVDETAAMAQLDRILEIERTVKRTHLRVLIRIRNELTAQQRVALAEKMRGGGGTATQTPGQDALQQRFQLKLSRIQAEVERRTRSGKPPHEAMKILQQFPSAMDQGNHEAAEETLDRVLKMLDLETSRLDEKGGETHVAECSWRPPARWSSPAPRPSGS